MSDAVDKAFWHLVIESSAGGVEALSELVSTLPVDLPAPIVIAQHLEPSRVSHLEEVLSRRSTLPVHTVTEHQPLQATIEELNATNDDLQARTTELQDLARTSEEERGRLRVILESIPEAVLVVDATGRTILTNAVYGRLFGETELEAFDNMGDPLMPDETPRARVAGGESFVLAFSARAQDGTRRSFKAEGKPIDDQDGKGGVIFVREVEEE